MLWNSGRKQYEFLLQIPVLILGAIGFFLLTDRGIYAAASVASLLFLSRALVIGTAAFKAVGLHFSDLVPHLLRGTLLSGLCVAGAFGGHYLGSSIAIPIVSLALSGLLTLALVLPLIWLRPQVLGRQTIEMLIKFVPRLSEPLKCAIVPLSTSDSQNPDGSK